MTLPYGFGELVMEWASRKQHGHCDESGNHRIFAGTIRQGHVVAPMGFSNCHPCNVRIVVTTILSLWTSEALPYRGKLALRWGIGSSLSSPCFSIVRPWERRIVTEEAKASWRLFLSSFKNSYMIKKLDSAGSPIGTTGLEILGRSYIQSDLDFLEADAEARTIARRWHSQKRLRD